MTRLTDTAILLIYASRFDCRFSGIWQEHICERNIRCFRWPSHLLLGSDQLNVTVYRTCTVPLWGVQRTVGSWSYWKNILGVTFIKFPTSVFHRRIWYNLLGRGGPNDRMNIGKWQRVCSQHFVDGPTPQHPFPTLSDYNDFKVSKSPRTPTARRCAPCQRMRRIQLTQWSGSRACNLLANIEFRCGWLRWREWNCVGALLGCSAADRVAATIKISALLPGAILTSKSGELLGRPKPGLT